LNQPKILPMIVDASPACAGALAAGAAATGVAGAVGGGMDAAALIMPLTTASGRAGAPSAAGLRSSSSATGICII